MRENCDRNSGLGVFSSLWRENARSCRSFFYSVFLVLLASTNTSCTEEINAPSIYHFTKSVGDATVYVAKVPLQDFELSLTLADNRAQSLQSVPSLSNQVYDSQGITPFVAVNASFWSAKNSFPIGPTALQSEWVTIETYKKWSSLVLTDDGPRIATVEPLLKLEVSGTTQEIHAVNARKDDQQVVMYNQYCGYSVPWLDSAGVGEMWLRELENRGSQFGDDSEREEDSVSFVHQKSHEYFAKNAETARQKLVLTYISDPTLNGQSKLLVVAKRNGVIGMQAGLVVVSGLDTDAVQVGDTVVLHSELGLNVENATSVVTSTPRLLRDGKASHEAAQEGTTSKRFINGRVPRTGLGWNEAADTVFMVCVTSNTAGAYGGLSLKEMSNVFKELGCYNAINLDGGGSTSMTINGELVTSYLGKQPRRVATALTALPLVFSKRSDGSVR